jgi:hypothetical protein
MSRARGLAPAAGQLAIHLVDGKHRAPHHALVDAQRLDLLEIDLDGVALHEAELGDHAPVGDGDLGGAHLDPRHREEHQPDDQDQRHDPQEHQPEL